MKPLTDCACGIHECIRSAPDMKEDAHPKADCAAGFFGAYSAPLLFASQGLAVTTKAKRMERTTAGFSLIELLVVVAIVAVLGSLLMPALHGVKGSSLNAKALQKFRQLMVANTLYAGEHGNQYVPVYNDNNPPNLWGAMLAPYLGILTQDASSKIFMDPNSPFNVPESLPASKRDSYARSIAMNGFIRNTANPAWNYRVNAVTHASQVLMFVEIQERNAEFISLLTSGTANGLAFRGAGGTKCRVGFCDGHADALTAEQLSYNVATGQIISTGITPPWGF